MHGPLGAKHRLLAIDFLHFLLEQLVLAHNAQLLAYDFRSSSLVPQNVIQHFDLFILNFP